jgi:hypothetical protein
MLFVYFFREMSFSFFFEHSRYRLDWPYLIPLESKGEQPAKLVEKIKKPT